jgi:single-stranded-DNA-specific exonuclease
MTITDNGRGENRKPRGSRWILTEPADPRAVEKLCAELKIPEGIGRLLIQRGIDDYEKARTYFRPSLDQLHDPFLMSDMDKATARLLRAIEHQEMIFVFGDYDVDGTNGASMLYLFLREMGARVVFYIPDRLTEGYGISRAGIDHAQAAGASVFLSVDCGITAIEQTAYATSQGMDVVICDHHEVGTVVPEAVAVLDPLKPGDLYPFKGLCGCGVGFKLIQALAQRLGRTDSLARYLEFVALATTADIVPMTGENRVLVRLGLETINRNPRKGIRALIETAGLQPGNIQTGHIVFALAPRINAVGRLGNAMRAVRLLISENDNEARQLARILEEENRQRRKIDEDTFLEAQAIADESEALPDDAAIVLHRSHWHPGVIGIVASRMVEKYYKPSIMMATVDGVAKGSARSVPGFDIYQALKRCQDSIIQFGGHKYAAGLTVDLTRFDEFSTGFKSVVNDMISEELKTPAIRIDTEISLKELGSRFVRILREFAPFGPGNSRPVFVVRGIEIAGVPRIVGKNHLRFRVKHNGMVFDAIGFGLGHLLPEVTQSTGRTLDCVFSIDEADAGIHGRTGNGDTIPQLKVKDLRMQAP